jgi:protein ImuB
VVRVSRLACVRVPWFAAAVIVRCEPTLAERPLVVVQGTPPAARVVEANAAARERGVASGMMEAHARALCPEVVRRPFVEARVASAQHALLTAVLGVSPRVEDAGPGLAYAEIQGLARLVGDDAAVGERLVRLVRDVGLEARVGIADGRTAARVASYEATRVTVVPAGRDAASLAPAPLDRLDLPEAVVTPLRRWGIADLGALAALPRDALAARLGPAGFLAHDLATGVDATPFHPWTPPPFWEEAQGLDWEVHDLGALGVVLEVVLARLAARLAAVHLAADEIDVRLGLVSGAHHERTVALAHPTRDVDLMLALLRLDLERRPPPAAVIDVALSVRPVVARAGQSGLWQPPAMAERDLAALLARLVRLVGADNVGSPALDDSYRPDAITLGPFTPPDAGADDDTTAVTSDAPLALRRLRPPAVVAVVIDDERPTRVTRGTTATRVVTCAGPWRVSGEWWDTRGWARDEWDLLLDDGTLCRLAHDHVSGRWLLDGVYD